MIKTFDDCFAFLIGSEGGYSNNPQDPGGETMYGITKRVAMQNGYLGDMKLLPLATAKKIAKTVYWDRLLLDSLDINVAFQVFDASYNNGQLNAAKWLQQCVGVKQDGIIGPVTIKATNAILWYQVVFQFLSIRAQFFTDLNTWGTFGKGWTRRISANLKIASEG